MKQEMISGDHNTWDIRQKQWIKNRNKRINIREELFRVEMSGQSKEEDDNMMRGLLTF